MKRTPINRKNSLGWTKASQSGAYSRTKWIKLRNYVLDKDPLCIMCKAKGIIKSGEVVDHIKAIDGEDDPLFYDEDNLQVLCKFHHSSKTKKDNSKYSAENIKRGKDLMKDLSS